MIAPRMIVSRKGVQAKRFTAQSPRESTRVQSTMLARELHHKSAREQTDRPPLFCSGRARTVLGAANVNRAPADRHGCAEARKELSQSPPEAVVCRGRKTGVILSTSIRKDSDGMENLAEFWDGECRSSKINPRVRFSEPTPAGPMPSDRSITYGNASDSSRDGICSDKSLKRSCPHDSQVSQNANAAWAKGKCVCVHCVQGHSGQPSQTSAKAGFQKQFTACDIEPSYLMLGWAFAR